jgi:hypothetical protein
VCFTVAHPDGSSSMFAALQHSRSRGASKSTASPFSRELLQGGHASVSA